MIPHMPMIKRAAPLVISGASSIYVVLRARRLSMAEPSDVSLLRFMISQPDLITVLVGVPASWYVTQRRQAAQRRANGLHNDTAGVAHGAAAQAIHSLRQVFSVLLLGTDLLARKAAKLEQADLEAMARRLKTVIRQGISLLAVLGEPHPPDLDNIYTSPRA